MMTTTIWTTDLLDESRRSIRARHVRYWLSILGLAFADAFCFLLADLIFRAGASVPTIVLFVGRVPNAPSTPMNVFAMLAAVFIIVRYISGDYSRRQLFFDGAKGTTIALLITAIPDLLMYALGGGIYALTPILLSWISLIVLLEIGEHHVRQLILVGDVQHRCSSDQICAPEVCGDEGHVIDRNGKINGKSFFVFNHPDRPGL